MTPEPLRQQDVDEIRLRVITTMIVSAVFRGIKKPDVHHLRFPKPHLEGYQYRKWNPPPDSERNTWERGLRLELDPGEIPASVARSVAHLRKQRKQESLAAPDWSLPEVRRLVLERERKNDRLWLPPGVK